MKYQLYKNSGVCVGVLHLLIFYYDIVFLPLVFSTCLTGILCQHYFFDEVMINEIKP